MLKQKMKPLLFALCLIMMIAAGGVCALADTPEVSHNEFYTSEADLRANIAEVFPAAQSGSVEYLAYDVSGIVSSVNSNSKIKEYVTVHTEKCYLPLTSGSTLNLDDLITIDLSSLSGIQKRIAQAAVDTLLNAINLDRLYHAYGETVPSTETIRIGSDIHTIRLVDKRVTPVIHVVSGDALTALNNTYAGSMTEAQLIEALFVSMTGGSAAITETFAGCDGLTVSPLPNPGIDSEQTVTFRFSGSKLYKAAEASVTFRLTPAPTDNVVSISGSGILSVTNAAESGGSFVNGAVAQNTTPHFVITPESGKYIDAITVTQDGSAVEFSVSYANTAADLAFSVGTNKRYNVSVTTKDAAIMLINGDSNTQSIAYPTDTLRSDIFAKADTAASVPGMQMENVIIEYNAGSADTPVWKPLDYTPSGLSGVMHHAFGKNAVIGTHRDSELVRITYDAADEKYPTVERVFTLNLTESRPATFVQLRSVDMTYRAEDCTLSALFDRLFDGVTLDAEGSQPIDDTLTLSSNLVLPEGNLTLTLENTQNQYDVTWMSGSVNAGTYKVTVRYLGHDKKYLESAAETTLVIRKADADTAVHSQIINYGQTPDTLITARPADASSSDKVDHISIVAGLNLGQGEAYIHMNFPTLAGIEFSEDISLSELSGTLDSLLAGTGIGSDVIAQASELLSAISEIEGMNNVKVRLSTGKDVTPTQSGVYLVGAVTSDANYNADYALGYLVIKPRAQEQKLAFNVPDENGLYTLGSIAGRDLGAHVVNNDALNPKVFSLFIGADADGNPVIALENPADSDDDTQKVRKAGVYTQIAFLADAGNEINYAVPIVRSFAVVPDLAVVKFIDGNGNENPHRLFTYDGGEKTMPAKVFNKDTGALLPQSEQAKITYYYSGVESDGDPYFAKGRGPSEVGTYNVLAVYSKGDGTVYGAAAGVLVIQPSARASISVTDVRRVYDGVAVPVNSMVTSAPADAARTIISAGVKVSGNIETDGFAALEGTINLDFPPRVDRLLEQAGVNRNQVLSASGLRARFSALLSSVSDATDSKLLSEISSLLNQIPTDANLTFRDNVSYADIGVYGVIGVITDPNYAPAMDAGVLVIQPQEVEFDVLDTERLYDGTEKFPDIVNEENLKYISIIRDSENNVNVILPEGWNIGTGSYDVQNLIGTFFSDLERLPESVKDPQAIAALHDVFSRITVRTLTINGAKPIEVGRYSVVGVAFGGNYLPVIDEGILTITRRPEVTPTPTPVPQPTATPRPVITPPPGYNDLPKTGDDSSLMLAVAALALSCSGLLALTLKKRASHR